MSNSSLDLSILHERPVDLIAMGRVAVDLYAEQIGSTLAEAKSFRKYLGGCAGNIAVGSARLGLATKMFSCVGQDEMGEFIKQTLLHEGVGIDLLQETNKHLTGLVLLGIKPPHDFPLMFYRNDCADMQIQSQFLSDDALKNAKALLLTGTGLSTPNMRSTTHAISKRARQCQTLVILDLDYRPVLWGLTHAGNGETRFISNEEVSRSYQELLPDCDLIVGTEEEICIAGGSSNLETSLTVIRSKTAAPIVIKMGAQGCKICLENPTELLSSKSFPVPVLNVLGAGDGFMAGLLRGLLRGESMETAMTYGNACGALVVTRHGCAPAIPYWDELNYFLKNYDSNPNVWQSEALAKLHEKPQAYEAADTLIKRRNGFSDGLNSIVRLHDTGVNVDMNFSALKLKAGQKFAFGLHYEFAAVLMTGRVIFSYQQEEVTCERADYFNEAPIVLHCSAQLAAQVEALTDCEILIIETENTQTFSPMLFGQHNLVEFDHRGKDLLEDTSYRLVKTVFDKRNRPQSNLVLGEIITFQGRWSSYPSHHHAQPEVYHYRFSEPQGFAFGENGKDVLRIEHNDTFKIALGQEHAHCVAPGYAMYTLWFIRHQQNNPYITPTFCEEHEWTRKPQAIKRVWQPMKFKE
ncbi:5-dehydro-2-deoxygluconokinase [Legionella hackeliae]|uniref:IolC/IolB transferase kinase protein n=1 Tax=Legionella hackeliae TaxID=449 RepID=A0A0A8UR17_LEGHA|nr:5-dehydro-2-deoxygluconokinase [Legionella hackeliae]KTD12891.1 IolC/IolB transferase kinase protein [Legionella hackeliae]CEK09199.1 IolC/IolB transferase kinase protein [Legionella hackeliae]STX49107.1 IolC/IolB transferase kinase protein [Legionella hackeliae]